MNRLILVGNGFDLAHNLKTKYADFLFSYIKNCFLKARKNAEYKDDLLCIKQRHTNGRREIEEYTDLKDFLFFLASKENDSSEKNIHKHYAKDYTLEIQSSFFEHLLNNCCHYNWVDIENEYYSHLKVMLNSNHNIEEDLKKLNNSFSLVITELEKHLQNQTPADLKQEYYEIFTEPINGEEIVTIDLKGNHLPDNSLILNFNYTQTVERYFSTFNPSLYPKSIPINYIHGQLNNKNNPIIFGFGDELDEHYKKIEIDKRRGFFNFIKSFWYFKTSNYHDLIRFIDSDIFQVYILGHSCGLSDRTMLNMIFEHTNCKSIKIFYYGNVDSNNFTELTQEISRHFNNKGIMRKKIVPLNKCRPMPQL